MENYLENHILKIIVYVKDQDGYNRAVKDINRIVAENEYDKYSYNIELIDCNNIKITTFPNLYNPIYNSFNIRGKSKNIVIDFKDHFCGTYFYIYNDSEVVFKTPPPLRNETAINIYGNSKVEIHGSFYYKCHEENVVVKLIS